MNLFRLSATIMAASLWISAACSGRTIYVSTTGTNNPPYTNWADATTNILWAVNATTTSNGDTVLINDGTYVLTNQVSLTKGLRVQSVNGAGATIVDGNNATRCFYMNQSNAVLDGLTITRGRTNTGGGVNAYNGNILNCVISNNTAFAGGGGIYIGDSTPVFTTTNCIIANNIASNGGGIYVYGGSSSRVTINFSAITANVATNDGGGVFNFYGSLIATNTTFAGNSALRNGGGLYINPWNGPNGTFVSCTFSNNSAIVNGGGVCINDYAYLQTFTNSTFISNSADYGGGVYLENCRANIQNSVICMNTATNGGGGGVYVLNSTSSTGTNIIENCVISNNTALGPTGARGGGGLLIREGAGLVLQNCTIINNRVASGYGGGGVSVRANSGSTATPTIRDCLIIGNTADTAVDYGGGGVFGFNSSALIQNCTIVSNFSTKTAGLYTVAGSGTSTVVNTIIYLNSGTGTYTNWYSAAGSCFYTNSCVFPTNSLPGAGNIQSDPLFASPSTANYRLGLNSPCVNRGLNMGWITDALDLDGRRRLDKFSGIVDIGCYERVPSGTLFTVW